jgi:hypothetical protein
LGNVDPRKVSDSRLLYIYASRFDDDDELLFENSDQDMMTTGQAGRLGFAVVVDIFEASCLPGEAGL